MVPSGCRGPKALVSLGLVQDVLKNLKTLLQSFNDTQAKLKKNKMSVEIKDASTIKSHNKLTANLEKVLREKVNIIILSTKNFQVIMKDS